VANATDEAQGPPHICTPEATPFLSHHPNPLREDFAVTPATVLEVRFRHTCWAADRQRVWTALQRAGASRGRLDRFRECGSTAAVYYSPSTARTWIKASYCHDKLCVPCSHARGRVLAANIHKRLKLAPHRFVTLTLRHSNTPLRDQVRRLMHSFSVYRRRQLIAHTFIGGFFALEVKLGKDSLWHPHLHVLAEGYYQEQRTLSAEWHAVTGDSSILHIRRIPADLGPAAYVAKYASKGCTHEVLQDPARLVEFISAMKGAHTFGTFGTWRGVKLNEPAEPEPKDARCLGTLDLIIFQALRGNAECQCILSRLNREDIWRTTPAERSPP
jgi:hypothetical protein